jgi:hypothetical protein
MDATSYAMLGVLVAILVIGAWMMFSGLKT